MSFWDISDPKQLSGWGNLYFTSNFSSIPEAASLGLTVLFDVEFSLLVDTSTGLILSPSINKLWASISSQSAPLISSKVLTGFFLGDELTWNGLSFNNLQFVANMIRNTFPTALIYYNEAYPVFTIDKSIYGVNIYYTHVPSAINWISIDFYPSDGSSLSEAISIFQTKLYPKLSSDQSALFVPPAYGSLEDPERYCGGSNCTAEMLLWGEQTIQWALSDSRLIGMNPWHWGSHQTWTGFEIGARDMPAVKNFWTTIGKQIINK